MSVNWKNVVERVVATTWQSMSGAIVATAEAVVAGQVDWRTALTGVAVAALAAFSKNLAVELGTPNADAGVSRETSSQVPSDADRSALTRTNA